MNEQKPEKKVVGRAIAIALGIICIILVAGLGGTFAYYLLRKDSTISSLNSEIATFNSQVLGKNYTIAEQNQTISSLETRLATMQEQMKHIHVENFSSPLLFIYNWTIYVQAGGSFDNGLPMEPIGAESPVYNVSSGYIIVWVSTNNNNTSTYVNIYGIANDTLIYNRTIDLGSNGIAIFPIPAGSFFGVCVGVSEGDSTITWSGMYVN